MKKRPLLLLLVFSLFLYPFQSPAHAAGEHRTTLPEGVTEIDLRTVLCEDAADLENAWMLNSDICILLLSQPEDGEDIYASTHYELIVLNMRDLSILSQTPISRVEYYYQQGREGNSFYLLFEPDGAEWYDPAFTYIKATIAPNGVVNIDDSVPNRFTVMPGGKMAIRTADDGSLYAVDLVSGEEDLLIQGVPGLGLFWDYGYRDDEIAERFPFWNEDGEVLAEYVPFWDELPENWKDWPDGSYPFEPNNGDFSIRQFHMEKPLDEHRFVYSVSSWEWDAGYGIYDLRTRTDHRITGRGFFYGMGGNTLYGSTVRADADTYEPSLIPESVRDQFRWIRESWYGNGHLDYDISPDGRLLALTGMKSRSSDADTVTLTDLGTGDLVKAYNIDNLYATEGTVSFYDDTHFILFCVPKENGSAYIYLFNTEE
jgi:hypothetical protein